MNKITWCQLLIGATRSSILSSLDEATTWEEAKETLLTCLGIGSVRDEAWTTLKILKKGAKDIVELAGEAEKLAKSLHPRDEEAAERHAVDTFLGALEKTLAAEVQKLGHRTMEDVVAAARRIEKILEEQTDSKMECLVNSMQDPDPEKGPQGGKRADCHSQSQCSNRGHRGRYSRTYHNNCCCRSSTACRSRSPHLPGLRRGTKLLPPSPPSNGSSPSTLLPLRRRRPLRVQLSCPPSTSTPPPPASMRQRPRPASRTNTGAADQRG